MTAAGATTGPTSHPDPDDRHVRAPWADDAEVSWGLGDAVVGLLLSLVLSLLVSSAVFAVLGEEAFDDLPLWGTALLQVPLWLALLGVPLAATRLKGRRSLKLDFAFDQRWRDVPVGLAIGLVLQLALGVLLQVVYPLLGIDPERVGASAVELTSEATTAVGVALLVLIVGVGAPFFEELFYRGLVLRAVQRRFGSVVAVLAPAVVFGVVHFQPYDLLPLVLFGVALGILTLRTGRLGPAIWAHVAFNLTAVISLLQG